MNEEKLMDAIGEIDDALINETDSIRKKKRRFPPKTVSAIAASLLLCVICLALLPHILNQEPTESAENISHSAEENMPPGISGNTHKNESELSEDSENTAAKDDAAPENESGIIIESTVSSIPVFVNIRSIEGNTLYCTVLDHLGSDNFKNGETVTIVIPDDTVLSDFRLYPGDSCYVEYRIENNNIIANKIYFKVSDNTPALY